MSRYVRTFKGKGGDKNKNVKLIFSRIDDDKLLENIKTFGIRLKILKILNYLIYQFMTIDI